MNKYDSYFPQVSLKVLHELYLLYDRYFDSIIDDIRQRINTVKILIYDKEVKNTSITIPVRESYSLNINLCDFERVDMIIYDQTMMFQLIDKSEKMNHLSIYHKSISKKFCDIMLKNTRIKILSIYFEYSDYVDEQ